MSNLQNIIQHYNASDRQEITRIINAFKEASDKYIIKSLGFVTPNIENIIQQIAPHFPDICIAVDGGYEQAIRKKIILYPEFYTIDDMQIVLIDIDYVNKFQKLDHRNILGAFLNSGIKESSLGDIIVDDSGKIQAVIDASIYDNLHILVPKINKLTITYHQIKEISITKKKKEIQVYKTKSLRLDAMIKVFIKLSRNQASKLIKSNKIKVNYSVINDPTFILKENDIISIRGYGLFEIEEIRQVNNGYNIFYR